jgi:hypothetical protein
MSWEARYTVIFGATCALTEPTYCTATKNSATAATAAASMISTPRR